MKRKVKIIIGVIIGIVLLGFLIYYFPNIEWTKFLIWAVVIGLVYELIIKIFKKNKK